MIDTDPAVHGSPYDDDRRVPLLFFGAGVRHDRSAEPARTIDLAPTLARLAGIPVPPGLDGRALLGPRTPAQRSSLQRDEIQTSTPR